MLPAHSEGRSRNWLIWLARTYYGPGRLEGSSCLEKCPNTHLRMVWIYKASFISEQVLALVDHNCSFIFCKSDLTSGLWKYTKNWSWFWSEVWYLLITVTDSGQGGAQPSGVALFSLHTTLSFSIAHSQQFYRRMALSIRSTLHVENELCPVWIVCGWTVQIKHVCVLQNKMHCYLVY